MSYPEVDIKYRQIFNHLPGRYLILNPDLTIVAASDSYLSATLTKRSEIINKYIFDIFPDNPAVPEARATEKLNESLSQVLRTGKTHIMDIQHYDIPKRTSECTEFETRYWCPSNIPVLDNTGDVEYIIHSVEDITEEVLSRQEIVRKNDHIMVISRKQTETSEALGTIDKRLRLITDIIPAMVSYVDNEHRYRFVNEAYVKNFHTSRKEIVGKKVEDFLAPYLSKDISKNIEAVLQGKVQSFEIKIQPKKDVQQHLEVIYLPDINDQGEIMGFVSMIMDVTDKVKYYDELTKLAEEKERLILQKDEFIEMASHELKTPLTTIKAYIELMLLDIEDLDHTTLRNYLGKANSYINQLHRLITGLFDVSTTNTGRLPYNFSYFNLKEVLEICSNNARNISKKHQIECHYNMKGKMYGDKERLEQVLDSLLNNAVKYSPDNNDILLKAEKENDEVLITVKDKGIGIPGEELDNIFKRFSRAHALSYHNSGLGLGLYLSREIVERHRGKIWAESEIGKGSTFYVKLPSKPVIR
ncbi:PAS domain-containing sensor histidine kinase [Fulvivirga ulvae]|uniref:sensor histidine kinase n=1 Tax=Fulvivirga ulvae TaxID=2904245 RepID=UPI001F44B9D7|nr:PAS domain-containing sensor histidine kinase [Fulvivirga ulvae]UII31394.1 PAS domain-containing sensor histidine kinase [Fulvivirga ulvae]